MNGYLVRKLRAFLEQAALYLAIAIGACRMRRACPVRPNYRLYRVVAEELRKFAKLAKRYARCALLILEADWLRKNWQLELFAE